MGIFDNMTKSVNDAVGNASSSSGSIFSSLGDGSGYAPQDTESENNQQGLSANDIWGSNRSEYVESSNSDDAGSFSGNEYDPDAVLRDNYNSWYRWKNDITDDGGKDYFNDTYGSFLGWATSDDDYVGTAQDWYDFLNQSWLTGDDRLESDAGGNANFDARNSWSEDYDNLYVEGEGINAEIPMEAIQQWYDENRSNYQVDDDDLMKLSYLSDPRLNGTYGSSSNITLDAIGNNITAAMLNEMPSNGTLLSTLNGGGYLTTNGATELNQIADDYFSASDDEKSSKAASFNNALKRATTTNPVFNSGMDAGYYNDAINDFYGSSGGRLKMSDDSDLYSYDGSGDESRYYKTMKSYIPEGYKIVPSSSVDSAAGNWMNGIKNTWGQLWS